MNKKNNILKEFGVLLAVTIMILSTVVVTANKVDDMSLENRQTCILNSFEEVGYTYIKSDSNSYLQNSYGPVLFNQLPIPDDSSGLGPFSDVGYYRTYDNFWGLTEDIHGVHWWGLWFGGSGIPTLGDEFEISFCADNGGIPDYNNHIVDFTGSLGDEITYVDTGKSYWGWEAYYMEMDLPAPVSMPSGWISFYKTNDDAQTFTWLDAETGDGKAYRTIYGLMSIDCSFQLIGEDLAQLEIQNVAGGLGVSAEIVNVGPITAENVNWELRFEGGVIISPTNGIVTGGPVSIPALGNLPVSTSAFGFGGFILPLNIVITATADNALPVNVTVPAKLLLIFVGI